MMHIHDAYHQYGFDPIENLHTKRFSSTKIFVFSKNVQFFKNSISAVKNHQFRELQSLLMVQFSINVMHIHDTCHKNGLDSIENSQTKRFPGSEICVFSEKIANFPWKIINLRAPKHCCGIIFNKCNAHP